MRQIIRKVAILAFLCGIGPAALAGPITLTATQPMVDWPDVPCTQVLPDVLPFALFDFKGQPILASLDKIEISLSMQHGATAPGEAYHNSLSLGLGTTDTGLKLNGFGENDEPTLSFTLERGQPGWLSDSQVNGILSAVNSGDRQLLGSILNTSPGHGCVNLYSDKFTTIKLTGSGVASPVPEPMTLLVWAVIVPALVRVTGKWSGIRPGGSKQGGAA